MKKACQIASDVADNILSVAEIGMKEYEIAAELSYMMQKRGAAGPSFETIAAFGKNSAEPHYSAGDVVLKKGDFMLLDFGALYRKYCSDITRTYFCGQASKKQREMYEIVLEAQTRALDAIKVGEPCSKPHIVAAEYIDSTEYKGLFTHGLGHGLGLAVHDGGGLNRARIFAKALEKGLVTANQVLSDQEVYGLIFEAGFSTAEAVTNLSGRGVGMDVVRRNIEALRGTVQIDSVEGAGTTVKIRLPLTLAIIDGFLMGVGRSSYVVPLDMVMECIELNEAERQETRDSNYINLRGTILPFIRLRDQFRERGKPARRENIVVVQYAGLRAGLVVDELMGEFQTVIKPLGKLFANLKGIGGSTILGSGEVALILDVPTLIQRAIALESRVLG